MNTALPFMVKLSRNQLLACLRNSGIWTTRDRLGIQRAFKDTCIPKRNIEDTLRFIEQGILTSDMLVADTMPED